MTYRAFGAIFDLNSGIKIRLYTSSFTLRTACFVFMIFPISFRYKGIEVYLKTHGNVCRKNGIELNFIHITLLGYKAVRDHLLWLNTQLLKYSF